MVYEVGKVVLAVLIGALLGEVMSTGLDWVLMAFLLGIVIGRHLK
jgi:hypothetical protein